MARARVHHDDAVLDATAAIVLARGARAGSVEAIARASGAPTGSLYHRFGSRDGVLVALWSRAVTRFHAAYVAASRSCADPVEAGVAMAVCVVDFARTHPQDARLLLTLRRADLLDDDDALDELNVDVAAAVRRVARGLPVGAERVRLAAVDLPYGAVRRHLQHGDVPPRLRDEVAAAARRLLTDELTERP